jgi:hypothetical protein
LLILPVKLKACKSLQTIKTNRMWHQELGLGETWWIPKENMKRAVTRKGHRKRAVTRKGHRKRAVTRKGHRKMAVTGKGHRKRAVTRKGHRKRAVTRDSAVHDVACL